MSDKTAVPTIPRTEKSRSAVPAFLTNRRGLILAAALASIIGLAFNWNWLVAVGIAPVLIAVLPCLVMCGFGLCMHKMTGRSCENGNADNGNAGKDGAPK